MDSRQKHAGMTDSILPVNGYYLLVLNSRWFPVSCFWGKECCSSGVLSTGGWSFRDFEFPSWSLGIRRMGKKLSIENS
jgi:hypothetical protein